jgi:hypothetical protein
MAMYSSNASETDRLFVTRALRTPEAKEALGEGFAVLLTTGDADKAWKAMIGAGQRNGSLAAVQVAFLFDLLTAVADILDKR